MQEHLIEHFWDDYYEGQGGRHTNTALNKLLRSFRQSFSIGSKINMDDEYYELAQTISFAKKHLG